MSRMKTHGRGAALRHTAFAVLHIIARPRVGYSVSRADILGQIHVGMDARTYRIPPDASADSRCVGWDNTCFLTSPGVIQLLLDIFSGRSLLLCWIEAIPPSPAGRGRLRMIDTEYMA
ncbi:hypothetical protein M431DRAFT_507805 [Trichoderma harzianum CBS 226.95]|uniref:Uncharacterized protein n=1 Tax=Trichoderma harzianum CBS 226.95 TaxID=983964 RepID=A0A2T4AGE3_TRIHA|nr:hypothetical protein M431DRAFT_507805 [Trichoderma harzianum CBS 226.95]PTB56154.1 hypothetical protein M431DRAFT_507805 [Trichoderma harzianum CBS 226.95]